MQALIDASLIISEIDYDIYRCFETVLKLNSGSFVTIKALEVQYCSAGQIFGSFSASPARIAVSLIRNLFFKIDYGRSGKNNNDQTEKLASLGIMGDQLWTPPETSRISQHYQIEGFKGSL